MNRTQRVVLLVSGLSIGCRALLLVCHGPARDHLRAGRSLARPCRRGGRLVREQKEGEAGRVRALAMATRKGGVGKTTTAAARAAELLNRTKRRTKP